ncbi:hypothetical protein [Magnetospira sp. QH-2]|uniref:hypothetical protein n=1 Tax=Magnetospira sp. (strain QH-2) TaxID=1288970 RepID=UPI0003E80F0A|nr:hypothetical protein [Magnetospira sp. QH-2]CCQ74261.1 Exported protein of unknown function [Magnetospira sp. QH-2]
MSVFVSIITLLLAALVLIGAAIPVIMAVVALRDISRKAYQSTMDYQAEIDGAKAAA